MLSKKQQTKRGARLRDDVSQRIEDKEYLAWCHTQNLVCFSCGKQNKIELHHVKQCSSDKKNDRQVIPLCGEECHRNGMKLSPHGTPKAWREIYPMKMQLEFADELYRRYKER